MFGTGCGCTDEEIEEAEKEQALEELDKLLIKLDPFYCDDDED